MVQSHLVIKPNHLSRFGLEGRLTAFKSFPGTRNAIFQFLFDFEEASWLIYCETFKSKAIQFNFIINLITTRPESCELLRCCQALTYLLSSSSILSCFVAQLCGWHKASYLSANHLPGLSLKINSIWIRPSQMQKSLMLFSPPNIEGFSWSFSCDEQHQNLTLPLSPSVCPSISPEGVFFKPKELRSRFEGVQWVSQWNIKDVSCKFHG